MQDATLTWRKSTRSGAAGHCVEVANVPSTVLVRDSKDVTGPVLAEGGQRTLAVGDERGQESLAAQDDAEHLGQRWIVIDDEYPGSHAVQYCTVLPNPTYPGGDLAETHWSA